MHNTTRIVQSIASSVVGYFELSRPFRPVLLLLGLHMDWLQVRLLLGVPLLLLLVGVCLIRLVFLLLILLTLGLLLCMLLLLFWLRLLLRLLLCLAGAPAFAAQRFLRRVNATNHSRLFLHVPTRIRESE